jgi:hypothetical protein
MPLRLKKLVGTLLILIWLFFYVLFTMRLAAAIAADTHWYVQLAFYAFAGFAWIVPPGFIIQWMGERRNG